MSYSIYDHANKSLVYDKTTGTPENGWRDMEILKFQTEAEAQKWKDDDLASGNYYNKAHTVYEIVKVTLAK
jgi:hypothetical protein